MTRPLPDEEQMKQYLLGELSEAQQAEFERQIFEDDRAFEELRAIEAELMDDYARETLKGRRRSQFERRLLHSPESLNELELAKLIVRPAAVDAERIQSSFTARPRSSVWQAFLASFGPHRHAWQLSVAVALILIAGAALWIIGLRPGAHSHTGQVASVPPRADITPLPALIPANQEKPDGPLSAPGSPLDQRSSVNNIANTPQSSPASTPYTSRTLSGRERAIPNQPAKQSSTGPPLQTSRSVIPTFALITGFERSEGGLNEINIPQGVDRIRLKMDIAPTDYETFKIALKRVEGQQILTQTNLKAVNTKTGRTLTLELPTKALSGADYLLTLTGSGVQNQQTVGTYFLRVKKQ